MSKKTINDELQNLSPLLRDTKQQEDGFRLPEGYFEALEESVFSRVEAIGARRQPVSEAKRGGLFARFSRSQVMWAAAAALALVLATTWLFKTDSAQFETPSVAAAQELTEEEIEAYVLENIRDFEAEQLAALPVAEQTSLKPESQAAPETKSKPKPKQAPSIDDLSDEELDILLKEMSDEELENLLKT